MALADPGSWRRWQQQFGAGLSAALIAVPLSLGLGIFALLPLASGGGEGSADRVVAIGAQAGLMTVAVGTLVALAFWLARPRAMPLVLAPGSMLAFLIGTATLQALVGVDYPPAFALACLALITAGAGLLQIAFGLLRFGNLGKYVPHPVVAGFQNAAAALLAVGQLPMVTAGDHLAWLRDPAAAAAATPPLAPLVMVAAFAGCLLAARRLPWLPAIPAGMLAGLVLHHALAALAGARDVGPTVLAPVAQLPDQAWQGGWALVHTLAEGPPIEPLLPALLLLTLSIASIASIDALLSAKAVENASRQQMNGNGLLLRAGTANLIGGVAGGVPASVNLAANFAAAAAGGLGLIGLAVCATLACGALLASAPLLGVLPRAAVGGALLFVAWKVLDRWTLYALPRLFARRKAGRARLALDLAVVAVVALTTLLADALVAIAVGGLIAVLSFVFRMSGTVVRRAYNAAQIGSRKARPERIARLLAGQSQNIHVFELQGALFFGTAEQLTSLLQRAARAGATYIVLDLSRVTEIDSTAARLLAGEMARLRTASVHTVLAGLALRPLVTQALVRAQVLNAASPRTMHADADHAIEWAEERIIQEQLSTLGEPPELDLARIDLFRGLDAHSIARLQALMQRREYATGDVIFQEGDAGVALHVIACGSASVRMRVEHGDLLAAEGDRDTRTHGPIGEDSLRMVTFAPGTVFGELALLDHERRSATVIADEPMVCHSLSAEALAHLREQHPAIALVVLRNVSRALAERLRDTTRAITHLTA